MKQEGATTVWWGRNPNEAKWLFDKCLKVNPQSLESLDVALARFRKKYGHLKFAVNYLETPEPVPFLETTLRDWQPIGPSVTELALRMKAQVGKMLETGGGMILNVIEWIELSPVETVWISAIQELARQVDDEYAENSVRAFNFYDAPEELIFNYLQGIGVPEVTMSLAD